MTDERRPLLTARGPRWLGWALLSIGTPRAALGAVLDGRVLVYCGAVLVAFGLAQVVGRATFERMKP